VVIGIVLYVITQIINIFLRFESYLIKAVIPGHITYIAYVMANTVVLNMLESILFQF